MANDNEYSNKVWFIASYHLVLFCLYTESQYVSVRHTVENGYMFITFFTFLPPVNCMSSCNVARLFGGYFFVFYSFRLTES